MKKIGLIIGLIIIIFILLSASSQFFEKGPRPPSNLPTPTIISAPPVDTTVNIAAKFEIYTNGTKRIFTSSMYHNLSEKVYIENEDPSVIHVKSSGITWSDFFETLPMELTDECLTTGTGQTFCTGENGILNFYLNGTENPDVLNQDIKAGDVLIVRYE